MASARILFNVRSSTALPEANWYLNALPNLIRLMPGRSSLTYRSPTAFADSRDVGCVIDDGCLAFNIPPGMKEPQFQGFAHGYAFLAQGSRGEGLQDRDKLAAIVQRL